MGYSFGFDIQPPLDPIHQINQDQYGRFIVELLDQYDCDDGSLEQIACLVPRGTGAYIEFEVGGRPAIPANPEMCQYFLRFSSRISGKQTQAAEPAVVRDVYRIAQGMFGEERVRWWHEADETDDAHTSSGWYSERQVTRMRKLMMRELDGYNDEEWQTILYKDEEQDEELNAVKQEDLKRSGRTRDGKKMSVSKRDRSQSPLLV
jgi:hypothetical protein